MTLWSRWPRCVAAPGCFRTFAARFCLHAARAVTQLAGGAALHDPTNSSILLPPLFGKLNGMANSDRELLPLLECLTTGVQWGRAACKVEGVSLALVHGGNLWAPLGPCARTNGCSRGGCGQRYRAVCRGCILPLHQHGGADGAGSGQRRNGS